MPDWSEIIGREGGAVWRVAYRVLGRRDDADECFQETFLKAFEVSCREPVRDWEALLHRLATARALDRLRQRYRRGEVGPAVDWDDLPGSSPSPSRSIEDAELSEALRSALAALPANQAEAFVLRHLEELSYREIAVRMRIPVVAVGVLLHRARKRLRNRLGSIVEPGRSVQARHPEESP